MAKPEQAPTETGQTVQKEAYFELAKDAAGRWHWMLWSGNHRAMAMNANEEGYERRNDCTAAIKAFRAALLRGMPKVLVNATLGDS